MSQRVKTLLVGGPLDGKVITVEADYSQINVPVSMTPIKYYTDPHTGDQHMVGYKNHVYSPYPFTCGGRDFCIHVSENFDPADAIQALIAHYANKTKEAP